MHTHDRPPRPPWYRDWNRPATPADSMRVSDAERTEVTDALCRHFAEGRLDEAELDDRTRRAAAAKTRADLAPLLADLPSLDAGLPEPTRPRGPLPLAPLALGVIAVVCGLWFLEGTAHSLLHPHVPWIIVLVVVFVLARRRHHRHSHGHW